MFKCFWFFYLDLLQCFIPSTIDGIDLNAKDKFGKTGLHLAFSRNEATDRNVTFEESPTSFKIMKKEKSENSLEDMLKESVPIALNIAKGDKPPSPSPIQFLIKEGPKHKIDLNMTDQQGKTPFHHLCSRGSKCLETLKNCLECNSEDIDYNAMDNRGRTGLHLACLSAFADIKAIGLLCQKSRTLYLDLNLADKDGNTAFHLICRNGDSEDNQFFVRNADKYGINLEAVNTFGKTGFDYLKTFQPGYSTVDYRKANPDPPPDPCF